ncbi:hypothetical protein VCUG_00614 [Vavraia culicis subsp. floridensis]|uniref:Uncharacterized protein n=1 Tax=Vavraia culicis (isolate floridensis) TaxID=948595 RepID=L2GWA1_VAVCU|nr:uncharacterized protein VCUG_00614 [Vavraia culicis subsp. floridensis]ELA47894.1 hypothetical protein VCUG_00614 [Vavraia culicis subsp. floridensis]
MVLLTRICMLPFINFIMHNSTSAVPRLISNGANVIKELASGKTLLDGGGNVSTNASNEIINTDVCSFFLNLPGLGPKIKMSKYYDTDKSECILSGVFFGVFVIIMFISIVLMVHSITQQKKRNGKVLNLPNPYFRC